MLPIWLYVFLFCLDRSEVKGHGVILSYRSSENELENLAWFS